MLSLIGDDGYPYGIPLSHFYDERDGKIYFHGAKEGKIRLVDDIKKAEEICTRLVQKFTDDKEYLEMELKNALAR